MKNKTSVSAQKNLLIELYLTWLIVWRNSLFRIDVGIHLIVRKDFPTYHSFRTQRIYYIIIADCFYEHGAKKIFDLSNIQQMSAIQQWELFIPMYIHTYTYKIDAVHQLHNCVCGVLSIKKMSL